jgi:hypothetical protein
MIVVIILNFLVQKYINSTLLRDESFYVSYMKLILNNIYVSINFPILTRARFTKGSLMPIGPFLEVHFLKLFL